MTHPSRHRRPKLASLFLWHRYLGLALSLLLLVLSLTGMLLNHSHDLGLDERYLRSEALLDLYGVRAPAATSYPVSGRWLSQVGERVFLDKLEISRTSANLIGGVSQGPLIAAAFDNQILLVDHDGRVVDSVDAASGVPTPLLRAGTHRDGRLIVAGRDGLFAADRDLLAWTQPPPGNVYWSAPSTAPPGLTRQLQSQYRQTVLTMERFVADLHSGRLFGRFAVYASDSVAVAFMALAFSGIVLWAKRWRQRRRRSGTAPRDGGLGGRIEKGPTRASPNG